MRVGELIQSLGAGFSTVFKEQNVSEAIELLAAKQLTAVVVLDGEKQPCGTFSAADLLRVCQRCQQSPGPEIPIQEVIPESRAVAGADEPCGEVLARMRRARRSHLPVTDASGELAGVVSLTGLLEQEVDALQDEVNHLQDYIADLQDAYQD